MSGFLKTFFDRFLGKAVVAHLTEPGVRIGDTPLVDRLFRSEVENHFKRLLVVRANVAE